MEGLTAPILAKTLQHTPTPTNETQQLFVLPDLNGKLTAFRRCLLAMDLIKPRTWEPTDLGADKDTHIVQLGDVVGMNQEALRIFDAMVELRRNGMNIDLLLGNHEVRMLAALQEHDSQTPWHAKHWQHTTDGTNLLQEIARLHSADELDEEHALKPMEKLAFRVLDTRGKYYELLGKEHAKVCIKSGNTVVTHAIPSCQVLERFLVQGDTGINAHFRAQLFSSKHLSSVAHSSGDHASIVWQYTLDNDTYPASLMAAMSERGVQPLVHGHVQQEHTTTTQLPGDVQRHNIDCIGHKFGAEYAVYHSTGHNDACCKTGQYTGLES